MSDENVNRLIQRIQLDIRNCREQIQEDIITYMESQQDDNSYQPMIDELCEIVVKNFKTLIVD